MTFGHLSARELAELWPRGGGHPHLSGCGACRAEYDALASLLEEARALAGEADAHFPPERLAAQQAQILRRIENAERPARVLRFPLSSRPFPAARTGARRWIAAAAAAGLLTGVIAGRTFDFGSAWRRATPPQPAVASNARQPALTSAGKPMVISDERLMAEIEALVEPRVDALLAIDGLTPRAREASYSR